MEQTFAEVFDAHHARALRLAFLLTGDHHAAEDVTADAFAKVCRRWGPDIRDPGAYISRAVVNTANSRFRRQGHERAVLPLLAEDDVHDDAAGRRLAAADEVHRALRQLPPRQRTVLVLRYFEDRSEQEIAQLMGTSRGTVKSSAARGLARLREVLDHHDPVTLAA